MYAKLSDEQVLVDDAGTVLSNAGNYNCNDGDISSIEGIDKAMLEKSEELIKAALAKLDIYE